MTTPGKAAFLQRAPAAASPAAPASSPATTPDPATPKRSNIPVRIANELASLKATAADAKADRDALAPFAKEALGALPKEWREYLVERAGDNPRKQLDELAKAKARGLIPSASATANPAARPAPATTSESPMHAPSKGDGQTGDVDVAAFRKHEALKAQSAFAAAQFYLSAGESIRRGKSKTAAS